MNTVGASAAATKPASPQARGGLIDRLSDLPEQLPGPGVAWILAVPAAIVLMAQGAGWMVGIRHFGVFEPAILTPAALLAYMLAARYVLRRVAVDSFERFRPALSAPTPEHRELQRALTSTPDKVGLVAVLLFEAAITGSYLTSESGRAAIPSAPLDATVVWVTWILAVLAFALLVLLGARQIRAVSRLHQLADRVDPFRPAAISAFSRLTVTLGLLLLPVMGFAVSAEFPYLQVPFVGALAVASFVLPLRGMHDRLVRERDRLLSESTDRLELIRARIHASVEEDDLARTTQLGATLSTLLAERDLIAKLPTWPWSSTIFRGFASAIVLPILVWLTIRLLERVI